MLYVIGYRNAIKDDFWAGRYTCPKCGAVSDFHYKRVKTNIHVCFIPILSITQKRLLVCDHCGSCFEIESKDYKNRLSQQKQKFDNKEFPPDVVAKDYSPSKLKMWQKILALVLSSVLMFIMAVGGLGLLSDAGFADGIAGYLLMLVIGVLPLAFSIKFYLNAKKKQKYYREVAGKQ